MIKRELETQLKSWKSNSNRKPLLIRGPKHVGKTHLVKKAAKDLFASDVIWCDFLNDQDIRKCFDSLNPKEAIGRLQLFTGKQITQGKTLVVLDNIHDDQKALVTLFYMRDHLPDLHCIGIGSYIDNVIANEQLELPIDNVEWVTCRPLSFKEFLIAGGYQALSDALDSLTPNDDSAGFIHEQASELFQTYSLIGGMPEVLTHYLEHRDIWAVRKKQQAALRGIQQELSFLTSRKTLKYLKSCYQNCAETLSQTIKYARLTPEGRSKDAKLAIHKLILSGLIHPVLPTDATETPLLPSDSTTRFKLLYTDIGLAIAANNDHKTLIEQDSLFTNDHNHYAVQAVGQELLAYQDPSILTPLYCWYRPKKGSEAEVDYVLSSDYHLIPIMVKHAKRGRLRALTQFLEDKQAPLGVQLSEAPLSFKNKILNVPLYLCSRLDSLYQAML